jgi:hypothetical protein
MWPKVYGTLENSTTYSMPRPPGTPRPPLGEISPNKRSRICGTHDVGIKFAVIARTEGLKDKTCRAIYKNAENQVSCYSRKRTGRPTLVIDRDQRAIFRQLASNPKITVARLKAQVVPHLYKFIL